MQRLLNGMAPYMWNDDWEACFLVMLEPAEDCSSFQQETTLRDVISLLPRVEDMDEHAFREAVVMGDSLLYQTYQLFNRSQFLTRNYVPYSKG